MRRTLIDRGQRYVGACMREREKRMFQYSGNLHFMSQLPEDHFEEKYAEPILEGAVLGEAIGRATKGDRNESRPVPSTVDKVRYKIPTPFFNVYFNFNPNMNLTAVRLRTKRMKKPNHKQFE